MALIFLSFIGSHDPGKAESDADGVLRDGPLPSVVRYLRSVSRVDRAILFYVTEYIREDGRIQPGFDLEMKTTLLRLKALDIEMDVIPIALKINPAREEDILEAMLSWLETNSEIANNEVAINTASGTPAMRAVWTFLVDAGLIQRATIWNSHDPYKPHEADRVYRVELGYLDEARHVYAASRLMQGMAFAEASDALASVTQKQVTTSRVQRVKLWKALLDTYTLWDRAFYQEALRKSSDVSTDPLYETLPERVRTLLDTQWKVLGDVAGARDHPKSLPILIDVYASLSRRFVTRQYPNIATRTRRIIDGCIRCAIGQDTTGTDVARKNSASRVMNLSAGIKLVKEGAEEHLYVFGPVARINLNETWGITFTNVRFLKSDLEAIWRIYNSINEHLNESIEVHGFRSPNDHPNGGRVRKMLEAAQNCLSVICNGSNGDTIPVAKSLAFGSDTIILLANELRGWV